MKTKKQPLNLENLEDSEDLEDLEPIWNSGYDEGIKKGISEGIKIGEKRATEKILEIIQEWFMNDKSDMRNYRAWDLAELKSQINSLQESFSNKGLFEPADARKGKELK